MKTITTNAREENALSMLHLFTFQLIPIIFEITGTTNDEKIISIYNTLFDRDPDSAELTYWSSFWTTNSHLSDKEVADTITYAGVENDEDFIKVYFTDHDIFVDYDSIVYTPISITFDKLTEDVSMQTNSINVTLDNVNSALSEAAINYEWRKNTCEIKRVLFLPNSETVSGYDYDFGVGDNLGIGTYPELLLDDTTLKDEYTLFSGFIGAFSATQQSLTGTITTKFIHWQNPFPTRTYDQKEFSDVIETIVETVYWGRVAP